MKRFIKAILWLPLTLLKWLWSIIWGFIQTILLLAIIIFGLLYYANHSDSQLANTISNISNQVVTFYNIWKDSDAKLQDKLSQKVSSDHYQHQDGVKWTKNEASVYIKTTNPIFVNAYQAALNNWNSTGLFQFKLVDSEDQADIVADETSDASLDAAGIAKVQSQELLKVIRHADVYLNAYYLLDNQYGYNSERIVHTAEHELGHSIGLDHKDDKESVMQSSGSFYGIQETDREAVRALYQNEK
ncbi:matrixin family metalloprotease [Streptococcus uberis]|uniref:matrixin family metalloprotease n=1 Tax=Streptococcus uberis TaxID=1349 RepID=UPI001FF0F322|nr:matrixin family metalloprotease [Streptococcus uberis]MCK1213023.1 matrixin family metalloprotease [Streptococcus uberis]MCK1225108.1 matrixin family metalloprotease [Streptococcus uberis]MCK1236453.1 matrixin family metalloprotease [Streptococcus uberis]MCK1248077.1 matrixin family metalloprotease [Streptococcus uberis]